MPYRIQFPSPGVGNPNTLLMVRLASSSIVMDVPDTFIMITRPGNWDAPQQFRTPAHSARGDKEGLYSSPLSIHPCGHGKCADESNQHFIDTLVIGFDIYGCTGHRCHKINIRPRNWDAPRQFLTLARLVREE